MEDEVDRQMTVELTGKDPMEAIIVESLEENESLLQNTWHSRISEFLRNSFGMAATPDSRFSKANIHAYPLDPGPSIPAVHSFSNFEV